MFLKKQYRGKRLLSGSGNITVESGSSIIEYLGISGSGNINLADVPAERGYIQKKQPFSARHFVICQKDRV
jgi:hypothetical protein